MDFGLHRSFAVDIDPSTGNMSVAWIEPQWSRSYVSVIGPSYTRVFINTSNYNEQMQRCDADTGKLLAASDFFPP
jgi:hypothetical protein